MPRSSVNCSCHEGRRRKMCHSHAPACSNTCQQWTLSDTKLTSPTHNASPSDRPMLCTVNVHICKNSEGLLQPACQYSPKSTNTASMHQGNPTCQMHKQNQSPRKSQSMPLRHQCSQLLGQHLPIEAWQLWPAAAAAGPLTTLHAF